MVCNNTCDSMVLMCVAFEFVQQHLVEIRDLFILEFFDFKSVFFFAGSVTFFYLLTATHRTASARFFVILCMFATIVLCSCVGSTSVIYSVRENGDCASSWQLRAVCAMGMVIPQGITLDYGTC